MASDRMTKRRFLIIIIISFLVAATAFFAVWRNSALKRSTVSNLPNKKTVFPDFFDKKTNIVSNKSMIIFSLAFENNGNIPEKYTCDGDNINPSLKIKSVPKEAKSLALVVDDPDSLAGTWIHWTIWNINPETTVIEEGSVPSGAVEGVTSFGSIGYGGPCPSAGAHRYVFKLFALDKTLEIKSGATHQELESMMSGHILDRAELVGLYKRVSI